MDKQRFDELLRLSEPLMQYIEANYDPHCAIVVDMDSVKIVRTEVFMPKN